jgi:hypothetical protein
LPGKAENRLVAPVGRQQRGGGVEHPGPGHDREHAGAAAGAGIAESHVAACLLVSGAHDADVLLALEGVEEAVDLSAGKAEHHLDVVLSQFPDDGVAAGQPRHSCLVLSCRLAQRCRCGPPIPDSGSGMKSPFLKGAPPGSP